jgi:hypothetical protein
MTTTTKTRRFTATRGTYQGTTDDRIDRWYIEDAEARHVDRRGPGYRTKREALAEAARLEEEHGV